MSGRENFLGFLLLTVILAGIMIWFGVRREREKKNSDCGEEHTVFISDTFRCPDGKQFIHVHMVGKSAQIMCCAKE